MNIDITVIKSALVSTVLMAVLAVAGYVISLGNVWAIDVHTLVNLGVMALLTGVVSLIKNAMTTENGNFAGITKVK